MRFTGTSLFSPHPLTTRIRTPVRTVAFDDRPPKANLPHSARTIKKEEKGKIYPPPPPLFLLPPDSLQFISLPTASADANILKADESAGAATAPRVGSSTGSERVHRCRKASRESDCWQRASAQRGSTQSRFAIVAGWQESLFASYPICQARRKISVRVPASADRRITSGQQIAR